MKILRNRALWAAVVLLALLMFLFRPGQPESDSPLSLTSTNPDGTKAMVMLLERFGTEVVEAPVPPAGGTALILQDRLGLAQTEEIEEWVNQGGTLIVADTQSSFVPFDYYEGPADEVPEALVPRCDSPLVEGVRQIDPVRNSAFNIPLPTFAPEPGAVACFRSDGGYYLMTTKQGEGRKIAISGADIFTNDRLAVQDNAVLVANLLSAESGQVTVIRPRVAGEGEQEGQGLGALLPSGVIGAIAQLVFAGLLFLLWRGRRLGRPLEEPLPVEVPASALTMAVAHLLQTAGHSAGAAHTLRRSLRRDLAKLLGLRPDVAPSVLADIAAERTDIDRSRLQYLLTDGPALDSQELLALAQELELLHQEVADVR